MTDGEDVPLPPLIEDMSPEDLIREVYATFGRAIQYAQGLEFALVNLNLLAAPGTYDTYEAIEEAMLNLLKETMGGLNSRLRRTGMDVDLQDNLARALHLRNFLVHAYFRERVFTFQSRGGQLRMIAELNQAASFIEGVRERLKILAAERFTVADTLNLNTFEIKKLMERLTGRTLPGLSYEEQAPIVVTKDGYLVGNSSVVRSQSAREQGETTHPTLVLDVEWENATEDDKARMIGLAKALDIYDLHLPETDADTEA
jgi:hypothetical protein